MTPDDRPSQSRLAAWWRSLHPRLFWQQVPTRDPIQPPAAWIAMLAGPAIFLLTLNVLLRPLLALAELITASATHDEYSPATDVTVYAARHLREYLREIHAGPAGLAMLLAGWLLVPLLLTILLPRLSRLLVRRPLPNDQALYIVARNTAPLALLLGLVLAATFTASAIAFGLAALPPIYEPSTEWWLQRNLWPTVNTVIWLVAVVPLLALPLLYLRAALHHHLHLPQPTRLATAALALSCILATLAVVAAMTIAFYEYS